MGILPTQLGTGTSVAWTIPKAIASRTDLDKINVYRSQSQNSGYSLLTSIPSGPPNALATSFFDTSPGNSDSMYYLVTFVSTASTFESSFHITYFALLPSEILMIEHLKRSVPPVIQPFLQDDDYVNGLNLAVQIFNAYPPQTNFTLENFPKSHMVFVDGLAMILTLASRFLTISIRDFRYSEPGGVVMDINRGEKISEAINNIMKVYTQYLPLIKLDFSAEFPTALGTVQLPLSMGGVVSRGLLNILDIFTAVGR